MLPLFYFKGGISYNKSYKIRGWGVREVGLHFVGTKMSKDGKILGYSILDEDTEEVRIIKKRECAELLKIKDIRNLRLNGTEIETTNGDIKRYYAEIIGDHSIAPVVILKRLMCDGNVIGYKVYIRGRKPATASEDKIIALCKDLGIANGKVVEKDGKSYIASISGEFDTVEQKAAEYRLDEEITVSSFINYFMSKGYNVINRGNGINIESKDTIVIENLSLPYDSNVEVYFNAKVRIKNLSIFRDSTRVGVLEGSVIENLRLIGYEGRLNDLRLDTVIINKCIAGDSVKKLSSIEIRGVIKEFIGSKSLNDISYVCNFAETRKVDLSKCVGENVYNSFMHNTYTGTVDFHMGEFKNYTGVLTESRVNLIGNIPSKLEVFKGFLGVINREILDLRHCLRLRVLGGMKMSSFQNVMIPVSPHLIIEDSFCAETEMSEIIIPDFKMGGLGIKISMDSFIKVKTLSVPHNVRISHSKNNKKMTCVVRGVPNTKIGYVPRTEGGSGLNLIFEEGIETLVDKRNRHEGALHLGEIILPKTLKEIGKEVFKNCWIRKINIEDTQVVRIGESAFEGVGYLGGVLYCPETLEYIENKAFFSSRIESIYMPEAVKKVGSNFFNGKVLYLVKDSYLDKTKSGAYIKIYVDGLDGTKGLIEAKTSTKRDLAKVDLAVGDGNEHKWIKDAEYRPHAKFILSLDRELESSEIVDYSIKLDRSKFIEFDLGKLGVVGEAIGRGIENSRANPLVENKDRFSILCNILTANTEFYAGHFTTKALSYYGDTVEKVLKYMCENNKNCHTLYMGRNSAIIVFPIIMGNTIMIENKAYAYIILEGNKIRYTTVVKQTSILDSALRSKGYHSRVEEDIVIGDLFEGYGQFTLSNKSIPSKIGKKFDEYIKENMVYYNKLGKSQYLSLNTGKLYETADIKSKWLIKEIEQPEIHKYRLEKLFEQEGCIRYFDILNGVYKGEYKKFKPEKAEIVRATELYYSLLDNNVDMDATERILRVLYALDTVKVRISKNGLSNRDLITKKLSRTYIRSNKIASMFDYSRGYSLYGYYLNEDLADTKSKTVVATVCGYDLSSPEYIFKKLSNNCSKPVLFKSMTKDEFEFDFRRSSSVNSGKFLIAVSKRDGYAYLIESYYVTSKATNVEHFRVVGLCRDEMEALKSLRDKSLDFISNSKDLGKLTDIQLQPFELAYRARNGEIPVGIHPEYSINAHKIFEIIGL